MFAGENYLHEPQDTKFKRTSINPIKEFKEFKQDAKKQSNEVKVKECRG